MVRCNWMDAMEKKSQARSINSPLLRFCKMKSLAWHQETQVFWWNRVRFNVLLVWPCGGLDFCAFIKRLFISSIWLICLIILFEGIDCRWAVEGVSSKHTLDGMGSHTRATLQSIAYLFIISLYAMAVGYHVILCYYHETRWRTRLWCQLLCHQRSVLVHRMMTLSIYASRIDGERHWYTPLQQWRDSVVEIYSRSLSKLTLYTQPHTVEWTQVFIQSQRSIRQVSTVKRLFFSIPPHTTSLLSGRYVVDSNTHTVSSVHICSTMSLIKKHAGWHLFFQHKWFVYQPFFWNQQTWSTCRQKWAFPLVITNEKTKVPPFTSKNNSSPVKQPTPFHFSQGKKM